MPPVDLRRGIDDGSHRSAMVLAVASRAARGREVGWALLLVAVLSAGVLGVLLLTTAAQQQSVRLTQQQQHVARLQARTQALRITLERYADPTLLAQRARRLHMRPAGGAVSHRPPPARAGRSPSRGSTRATRPPTRGR